MVPATYSSSVGRSFCCAEFDGTASAGSNQTPLQKRARDIFTVESEHLPKARKEGEPIQVSDYFRLRGGTIPFVRRLFHQLAVVIGDVPHRSGQGREAVRPRLGVGISTTRAGFPRSVCLWVGSYIGEVLQFHRS